MKNLTLATQITIIRIVCIPIFLVALVEERERLALWLFTFCILTDALDGALARLRHERTALGAFLDPLADKILILSGFATVAWQARIPTWPVVAIFGRDLIVFLGWVLIYILTADTTVSPRLLGKATTICQMLCLWLILAGIFKRHEGKGLETALILTTIITTLSGLDYVREGSRRLGETRAGSG